MRDALARRWAEPKVRLAVAAVAAVAGLALFLARRPPADETLPPPPVAKNASPREIQSVTAAGPLLEIRALSRPGCALGVPNLIEAEMRARRDALAMITLEDLESSKGARAIAARRITADARTPGRMGALTVKLAQLPERHPLGLYICSAGAQRRGTCRTKTLRDLDVMAKALPGPLANVPGALEDKVYYFQLIYRVGNELRFIRADASPTAFDFAGVGARIRRETGLAEKAVRKMAQMYMTLPWPTLELAEGTPTGTALQLSLPIRQDALCQAMRARVADEAARARSPSTRFVRPRVAVQPQRLKFDFDAPTEAAAPTPAALPGH
jgi:hypothetical protein